MLSEELGLLAVVNLCASAAAGWTGRSWDFVALAHAIAFLLGVLESKGEYIVCDDPDVRALTAEAVTFVAGYSNRSE